MTLSTRDLATIRSLSRADVKLTLKGLRRFVGRSYWVGRNNTYTTDTVKKIKNELAAGGIANPRHLSQYIAASVVLHCSDGWSYLGRALGALLRGDPHRARHLAYYAELRAAMSLLASIGIGVFNNRHLVINGAGSVASLACQYKTHEFVWDCLETWGDLAASGDMFARIVRPHGIQLSQWLQPVGGATAVAAQARSWFSQWGMDLKVPHFDQFVRNESSYRPDGMRQQWSVEAAKVLSFARDFWSSMEPSTSCRFENVDSHILRVAVESVFKSTTGRAPAQQPVAFKDRAKKIVEAQALGESATQRWIEFLCRNSAAADIAIMAYSKVPPSVVDQTYLSVFARAALLLRLATGSASELLADAGFSMADTAFWWGSVGNSRGIWDGSRTEGAILDLWADVDPVLRSIHAFQTAVPAAEQTFYRAAHEIVPDISCLGSCERIAVWGLTH